MEWVIGIASFAFFLVIGTLIGILLWETNRQKKKVNGVDAEIQANLEHLEQTRRELKVIK